MDIIQAVWLAIIQGLSEFLPVSSSAHLILPSEILGWPDQGLAFDVAVHVGSLAAVLIYFRDDILALLSAWFDSIFVRRHTAESRMAWCLAIGTIPAGLAGLLLSDLIELYLRSMEVIAFTTIFFGLLLAWADVFARGTKGLTEFTWKSALVVGVAQALALIPGTSRSGVTMTAALGLGFDRQTAARFSFLLAIPIIALSGAYKGLQLLHEDSVALFEISVGAVLSGITAYICIHSFLRFVERVGMMPFVIYRMFLGGFLIYLSW